MLCCNREVQLGCHPALTLWLAGEQ